MATPKPGPGPVPSPPVSTIHSEVSPLQPQEGLPIPTIATDVSPIRSDGSASIGIFTPEALAPVIPPPSKLPRSNQGVSLPPTQLPRSNQGVKLPGAEPPRLPAIVFPSKPPGETARAPAVTPISPPPPPPPLAPWSTPSMTPTNMAKTNIQRMDGPSSKFGSTGGIVNRSLLTPMSKSALPPQELGSVAQYQLHELIGEGGMGLVFRAEDTFLKRLGRVEGDAPGHRERRAGLETIPHRKHRPPLP